MIAAMSAGTAWLLTGVCIVIVAIAAGRRWASRKQRLWMTRYDNGLCLHCGYDKRADPRGRCPECGRF